MNFVFSYQNNCRKWITSRTCCRALWRRSSVWIQRVTSTVSASTFRFFRKKMNGSWNWTWPLKVRNTNSAFRFRINYQFNYRRPKSPNSPNSSKKHKLCVSFVFEFLRNFNELIDLIYIASCVVTSRYIQTLDNVTWPNQFTDCYSLISSDCGAQPSFAIFARKSNGSYPLVNSKKNYKITEMFGIEIRQIVSVKVAFSAELYLTHFRLQNASIASCV